MTRVDGRTHDELRPISFERGIIAHAQGSVIVSFGRTRVLCAVMVEDGVPPFLRSTGKGWLTAEYSMLPYSTPSRLTRHSEHKQGRSHEIQRLIGRSLRAAVDLDKIPEKTIWIDCDVLQADGGTRCAAITGAFVCLLDVDNWLQRKHITTDSILRHFCAAVSVGLVDNEPMIDLAFQEDSRAQVDMNLVMTAAGEFIEIQISGEEHTFSSDELTQLLALGKTGIQELITQEKRLLQLDT